MTQLRTPPESIAQRIEQLSARAETLEEQLIRSQRLVTLGTLSMIMAHEVNNQLMTIINRAEVAKDCDADDGVRRALDRIVSSSQMASTMIKNIMGFAASRQNEPVRMNAAQLMEESLGLMARPPAKDGIEVRRDYDEALWVNVPPVGLMQVLLNLVINAGHAMAGGGGTLTLKVRTQDDYVALEVADTGTGIAAEHMDRLFEPFFTTKDGDGGSEGTGLGLYISRKIVRDCGGDIAVLSRPGDGATFTVYLPAADPPPES